MDDTQATARMAELDALRKARGLSEAEWEEVALLFAELGDREQAAKAMGRAAEMRRQGMVNDAVGSPLDAPTLGGQRKHETAPSGSSNLRVLLWGLSMICAFGIWVMFMMLTADGRNERYQAELEAQVAAEAAERTAVRAALDQAMPAIREALASAGATVTAKVDEHGGADLNITVPTVMSEPEAMEVARLVMDQIPLPARTGFTVRVHSPSGQRLATYWDVRASGP